MANVSASVNSNNFASKLLHRISENSDFLDVVLCAEDRMIEVHRVVLAANSSYFRQALKIMDKHKQTPAFFFTDMKFEHLKHLVEYMYTGETHINNNIMDDFLRNAEKLKIIGLCAMDKEMNSTNITYEIDSDGDGENSFHIKGKNKTESCHDTNPNEAKLRQWKEKATSSYVHHHFVEPLQRKIIKKRKFDGPENLTPNKIIKSVSSLQVEVSERNRDSWLAGLQPASVISSLRESHASSGTIRIVSETSDKDTSPKYHGSVNNNENMEYNCTAEGCNESFRSAQERKRHLKFKCGKTMDHQCASCGEAFHLRHGLIKHKRNCQLYMAKNMEMNPQSTKDHTLSH